MELFYNRYRRIFIAIILSIAFWLLGGVCMAYEINFTGFSFSILSLSSLLYVFAFYVANRKNALPFSLTFTKVECIVFPMISLYISMTGIIESATNNPDFTTVFYILLIYTLLFIAVQLRNYYLKRKNATPLSKSFINKLVFFAFLIGFARVIIMIEQYGDSDALVIAAFIYFPLLFFISIRWIFKQMKNILNLKNEKTKTELMHLKSQVNPHFFFNMLNNLYGWVDKDTDKAKKLIISLSEMMRYSIYEGDKSNVTLKEEVEYMQKYIELHRMRYHKEIDIQFSIDIKEETIPVMPLMFIILLENAFKHGVENLRENAFVYLKMLTNDTQIVFEIENNFDPNETPTKPGIGIQNITRRLELVYPKKHSLILNANNNIYKATLIIEL